MNDDYENVEWNVHGATDVIAVLGGDNDDNQDPLRSFRSHVETNSISDRLASFSTELPTDELASTSHTPTTATTAPEGATSSTSPSTLRQHVSPESFDAAPASDPVPMTIHVSDPQKHADSRGSFVSYLITTITSLDTFSSPRPRPVRRRFQDFVWLYDTLSLEYPACIIPPLPEKHRLEYIKGDRFSTEFIERRKQGLQWFVDRLARHPLLQTSSCTRIFLESPDFKSDQRAQSSHVPPPASVLETLSDSLLNVFAKVKKPDERFVDMRENIDKLEDNLATVERLYSRIGKRQHDLQTDYAALANSIQGLSALEAGMNQPLHQVAETIKAYVKAIEEMTSKEEDAYLSGVHEMLAYCHTAKEVLRARDQKQVDFEELSVYLQQSLQQRDRAKYPGRHVGQRPTIAEYVTNRINEVRGVDLERARKERLLRLELRCKELQEEVARTNDISNAFSNQVLKEYSVFQKAKAENLKQGLEAYADCHIAFYERGMEIWQRLLPILEQSTPSMSPMEEESDRELAL